MASAAEAEFGTIFINAQKAVPIRTTLIEMGWPQGPTPIQVDNSTAVGIANKTMNQKKSKAMDMRFYWINDRIKQEQFRVYWAPGPTNLGDYPSKHHPPAHHITVCPTYLHVPKTVSLQGCVNLTVNTSPAKRSLAVTVKHIRQQEQLTRYYLECVKPTNISSYSLS